MKLLKLLLVALLGCHLGAAAQEYDGRHGWPEQKAVTRRWKPWRCMLPLPTVWV